MNKGYLILAIVMIITLLPLGLAKEDKFSMNSVIVTNSPNETSCEGSFRADHPCSYSYDNDSTTYAIPNNAGAANPVNITFIYTLITAKANVNYLNYTFKYYSWTGQTWTNISFYNWTAGPAYTLDYVNETGTGQELITPILFSADGKTAILDSYAKANLTVRISLNYLSSAPSRYSSFFQGNLSYVLANPITSLAVNLSTKAIPNDSVVGQSVNFTFQLNSSQIIDSKTAIFYLNNTNYSFDYVENSSTQINFTKILTMPQVSIITELQYNWTYSINNYSNVSDTQNIIITPIGFSLGTSCLAGFTTSFNFTFYDEISDVPLSENLSYNIKYGIANSSEFTTYGSLSNKGSFVICFNSSLINNFTISNVEFEYSRTEYFDKKYYLLNTRATNVTVNIPLYSILTSLGQQFYFDVKSGAFALADAYVVINKKNIANDSYKTIGIRKTDDSGKFIEFLELNKDYQYIITRDNVTYSPIYKNSICSATPCEITLQITGSGTNIYSGYYDLYATNVQSTLTFNKITNLTTYTFYDVTGLAHYFELQVFSLRFDNSTNTAICDNISYTTSGSLTCDLTGHTGNFRVYSFVSRSPEKFDKIIDVIINSIMDNDWQVMQLFGLIVWIVTFVIAGSYISQGNPSIVVFSFAMSILTGKLIMLFPFSWMIVSAICLLCFIVMGRLKT